MKKSCIVIFLLIVNLMVLSFRGLAQDEIGKELKVLVGEVKIIAVSNPTRIVIGNPNVADVTDVTKKEITLSAKAPGSTTLVFWDNSGEQSYRVRVLAENVEEIKRRVDYLLGTLNLPEIYTQIAEEEGKILLLGRVKSPQDRERISTALGILKDKTMDLILVKEEEAVVEIDVQVLELSKDAEKTLGFSWPSPITLTETGSPGIATAGTKWSTLFKVLSLSREAFSWTLDALVQEGKARVLSRPRLACQSGKEAELAVGGEKPTFATYVTEAGGAGATVEYKEYGIKLKIKPTVTDKERIKIALNVEVSEVEAPESMGTWARAYPLKKRTTSTELFINDGQTLAIGGLIKQKTEEDIQKTPWFGDIPVLGLLFRKKTTKVGGGEGERGDTELFITLTPTIVKEVAKKEEAKPEILRPIRGRIAKELSVSEYVHKVSQQIRRNLVYPWLAKDANLEGSLRLRLRIYYTGQLLDVEIRESSGFAVLDENAVNIVKKVAPYPLFPPEMKQKELRIDLPIIYKTK